jgi:hypothetical protein
MRSVITASSAEYAAASIELYSRLWQELEQLICRLAETDGLPTPSATDAVVTFRLQLVVLADACVSTRWRSLLAADQRQDLRSTLERVRRTLAVPPHALGPWAIAQAQNQLLDAVLDQYNAALKTESSLSLQRAGSAS